MINLLSFLIILPGLKSQGLIPSVTPTSQLSSTNDAMTYATVFMLLTFALICGTIFLSAKTGLHFNLVLWAVGLFGGALYDRLGIFGSSFQYIYGITLYIVILLYSSSLSFCSSYFANNRLIYQQKWQIALVTVGGVFATTLVVGGLLKLALPLGRELTIVECFVLASIFGCVGPESFFARLPVLRIGHRVGALITAEAGLTPGFSVSVYLLFDTILSNGKYEFGPTLRNFIYQTFGGAASGIGIALASGVVLTMCKRPMIAAFWSVFASFFTVFFCFGQPFGFYFNSLFAMFFFGNTLGYVSKEFLRPEVMKGVESVWSFIVVVADATCVLLCGGFVGNLYFKDIGRFFVENYFWQIFAVFAIVLGTRAAKMFAFWPLLNLIGERFSWKDVTFLSLVGINGTISVTFALDVAMMEGSPLWSPHFKAIFVGVICFVVPVQVLFVTVVNFIGWIDYPEVKLRLPEIMAFKERFKLLNEIKANLKEKYANSNGQEKMLNLKEVKGIFGMKKKIIRLVEKMICFKKSLKLSQRNKKQAEVQFLAKHAIPLRANKSFANNQAQALIRGPEDFDSVSRLRFFSSEGIRERNLLPESNQEKIKDRFIQVILPEEFLQHRGSSGDFWKNSNTIFSGKQKDSLSSLNKNELKIKAKYQNSRQSDPELKILLKGDSREKFPVISQEKRQTNESKFRPLVSSDQLDIQISGLSSYLELNRTKTSTITKDSQRHSSQSRPESDPRSQLSKSDLFSALFSDAVIKDSVQGLECDLRDIFYLLLAKEIEEAFSFSRCGIRTYNFGKILISICRDHLDQPIQIVSLHDKYYHTFFGLGLGLLSKIPGVRFFTQKADFINKYIEFELIKLIHDFSLEIIENTSEDFFKGFSFGQKQFILDEIGQEVCRLQLFLVELSRSVSQNYFYSLNELLLSSLYKMCQWNNQAKLRGNLSEEQYINFLEETEKIESQLFLYFCLKSRGKNPTCFEKNDLQNQSSPMALVYHFPFLLSVSMDALESLSRHSKIEVFAAGSCLHGFSGISRIVYFLKKGSLTLKINAKITKTAKNPRNQILIEPFILQNLGVEIKAETNERCVLYAIDFEGFWEVLEESEQVLWHFALTLTEIFWESPELLNAKKSKENLTRDFSNEHLKRPFSEIFSFYEIKKIKISDKDKEKKRDLACAICLDLAADIKEGLERGGANDQDEGFAVDLRVTIFGRRIHLTINVK